MSPKEYAAMATGFAVVTAIFTKFAIDDSKKQKDNSKMMDELKTELKKFQKASEDQGQKIDSLINLNEKRAAEIEKLTATLEKVTEQNEANTVTSYESERDFEKYIRKLQSHVIRFMIANSHDEDARTMCFRFTEIVDSYEGPEDIQRIYRDFLSLQNCMGPTVYSTALKNFSSC